MISYLVRCPSMSEAKRIFYRAHQYYGRLNLLAKTCWSSAGGEIRLKNDEADYRFVNMDESFVKGTWRVVISGEEFEAILGKHIERINSINKAWLDSIGVEMVPGDPPTFRFKSNDNC